jgi:hypothetical protein
MYPIRVLLFCQLREHHETEVTPHCGEALEGDGLKAAFPEELSERGWVKHPEVTGVENIVILVFEAEIESIRHFDK